MQTMVTLDQEPINLTKMDLKWITVLNVKCKNIRIPEEKKKKI